MSLVQNRWLPSRILVGQSLLRTLDQAASDFCLIEKTTWIVIDIDIYIVYDSMMKFQAMPSWSDFRHPPLKDLT